MDLEKYGLTQDLKRWSRAYIDYIDNLSYSNNTIETYKRIIDTFIQYSKEYGCSISLKQINTFYIASFLSYIENIALKSSKNKLKEKGLSKSTKELYVRTLKSFFSFISDNNEEGFSFDSVFKKLKMKIHQKQEEKISYLSDDETDRLLDILQENIKKSDKYNTYRNALLIKTMLFAGLRISEALRLRLSDFQELDEKTYKIKIVGKGQREQYAYIAKSVIEEEMEYFKHYCKEKEGLIMVTRSGKPLHRQNAYEIVRNIYKKAGIKKQGVHILRHTYAMKLTKKGVNPLIIKKAMRHANINSTMIYAKAEEGDVVKAIENLGKRNN